MIQNLVYMAARVIQHGRKLETKKNPYRDFSPLGYNH